MTLSLASRRADITALLHNKWVWVVTAIAVIWNAAIFFDWSPYVLGPSSSLVEWRWLHVWPPNLVVTSLWLPLAAVGLIVAWAFWTRALPKLKVGHLLVLVGLALTFRLAMQSIGHQGLSIAARVLNPSYFGYFQPATKVEALWPFLHTYAEDQAQLGYRVGTHPPGDIVLYWGIIKSVEAMPWISQLAEPYLAPRIAAAPPWMADYTLAEIIAGSLAAVFVPLCSCLSLIPFYYLAQQLAGPAPARLGSLLLVFLPASTAFMPIIDDFYVLLAVLAMWFVVSGLVKEKGWLLVAGGFMVGIGLFESLSTIPLAAFIGLFILLSHLSKDWKAWQPLMRDGLLFGLGTLLPWLLVWMIFGLNPIQVYLNCLNTYEAHMRSYWAWLIYDPYDILLFAGAAVAIHFVAGLVQLGQRTAARQTWSLLDCLAVALVLAFSLLFVSGSLRGETARTLLYVFPFVALIAAQQVYSTPKPAYYTTLILALTGLQTFVFQIALAPYH